MHSTQIRAVIFDCDGVLLDTEPLYTQAANVVMAPYGKTLPLWLKFRLLGQSGANVAQIMVDTMQLPMTPQEYRQKAKQEEVRLFPGCPVIPGAEEAVMHCHQRGIPMAIATSSIESSFAIKMKGKEDKFLKRMCGIVTGDQVINPKPHPEIFLKAYQKIIDNSNLNPKLEPRNVLVIEDSPSGVRAALAADMQVAWLRDAIYNQILENGSDNGYDLNDLKGVPTFSSHQEIMQHYLR